VNLPIPSTRQIDRDSGPISGTDSFSIPQISLQTPPVAYPLH